MVDIVSNVLLTAPPQMGVWRQSAPLPPAIKNQTPQRKGIGGQGNGMLPPPTACGPQAGEPAGQAGSRIANPHVRFLPNAERHAGFPTGSKTEGKGWLRRAGDVGVVRGGGVDCHHGIKIEAGKCGVPERMVGIVDHDCRRIAKADEADGVHSNIGKIEVIAPRLRGVQRVGAAIGGGDSGATNQRGGIERELHKADPVAADGHRCWLGKSALLPPQIVVESVLEHGEIGPGAVHDWGAEPEDDLTPQSQREYLRGVHRRDGWAGAGVGESKNVVGEVGGLAANARPGSGPEHHHGVGMVLGNCRCRHRQQQKQPAEARRHAPKNRGRRGVARRQGVRWRWFVVHRTTFSIWVSSVPPDWSVQR
ncbi:MAG: hypothetical protein UZ07_CHB004001757 [Chlorobi bacterium OLB7]|nr:MAG: hypothetical protein UZ07_CHB004001757 [Chlorobi bacterium OLB7]